MDELDDKLGQAIEDFHVDEGDAPIKAGLIGVLDRDIYRKLLQLKSDYNRSAPFNRDPTTMTDIVNKILKFLQNFHQSHLKQMNNTFRQLII